MAIAAASMWKANTKGLIDVKLENQEWKTYIDSRRAGRYDAHVQDGMRITTKQQHSATISYLILVTIPRNTRTQNMIKPLQNLTQQLMQKVVRKLMQKPKKFLQRLRYRTNL